MSVPPLVRLNRGYAFVISDPGLRAKIKTLLPPPRKYVPWTKGTDFLLTYMFAKKKSYVVVYRSKVYYLINDALYQVQSCLDCTQDVCLEGDISGDYFLLSDITWGGVPPPLPPQPDGTLAESPQPDGTLAESPQPDGLPAESQGHVENVTECNTKNPHKNTWQGGRHAPPFAARLKELNTFIDEKYRHDVILDPYILHVVDFITPAYCQSFMTDYKPPYAAGASGWLMVKGYTTTWPEYSIPSTPFLFDTVKLTKVAITPQPTMETACFRLAATELPDIYKLFLAANGGEAGQTGQVDQVYYDIACVPDKITSAFLLRNIKQFSLYKCVYHERFKRWQPVAIADRLRPDSIVV